jgi:2-haloacid dehalogenase
MVAVFDLVGTLYSVERVRAVLQREGAPADFLDCWFADLLQTAMTATLAERYVPFRQAAEISLTNRLEKRGLPDVAVTDVLASMQELEPYPDARECLESLRDRGIRRAVLTNSSRENAMHLLRMAGLEELIESVISTDEVEKTKPHPAPYRLALDRLDTEPEGAWLVAGHGWDIYGAAAVGLHTVWVFREAGRWPFPGEPPGATVTTLAEVPEAIQG